MDIVRGSDVGITFNAARNTRTGVATAQMQLVAIRERNP
jgi:hypothetical protein